MEKKVEEKKKQIVKEPTQQERIDILSQDIFKKPAKDIKYLYVTNYIHQQLLDEELARTGLYQWINVFRGDIKYPRNIIDYNDYDIVQVNMSTQDIPLLTNIRENIGKDSKTKLVVNNDYTSEIWQRAWDSPEIIRREVDAADMVFGTEYYQVSALSELLRRKVFVIPHPADVRRLKALPKIPTKNTITTIWRRYDNFSYVPSLAVRNHGLTTQLIGFNKDNDQKVWLTTSLYDYVLAGTNFFDFCDQLRESTVVYDPFTYHSYNRAIVDCAAMGIPVVGSNRTQSINTCYPFTKVDPYDVTESRRLIERILKDDDFREKVIKQAQEAVEVYNHPNSMEKYLTALQSSLHDPVKLPPYVNKTMVEESRGDDVNTLIANDKTRKTNKGKN